MKHTHVVPPYITIKVFSLKQTSNVDVPRKGIAEVPVDKFQQRMAAANKLRADFYKWGQDNGDSAIALLEDFLHDNQPEGQPIGEQTLIVAATFHNIMKDSRDTAAKCKMKHGSSTHEEIHALDLAARGILFGLFLLEQNLNEQK